MENWREIQGYEGLYEVSDLGRVRSLDRYVPNRWKTTTFKPGRMMIFDTSDRYLRVYLSKDGLRERYSVHILVIETFVGPRPDGHEARHLDGDNRHNALSNLAWGTKAENTQDRYRHGTQPFGEIVHNHVLDEARVRTIRRLAGTMCLREIGELVGCHTSTVHHVISGRTWSHIST